MKKVMLGAAVALALTTSYAAADGIDRRYPPTIAAPAPIYAPTWSGFYIGAGFGAGAVVHDLTLRDDLGSLFDFDGIGGEGVLGTVVVGLDWQLGTNTVLGVFADYDFSDISTDVSFNGRSGLDGHAGIDLDHTWSVGARLGWLSSPSTLWYATGGYTESNFDAFVSSDLTGGSRFSRDRTFSGYFVGAGVDTRIAASNWFLRLEYRFSQFDDETIFRFDDDLGTRVEVEPSTHTARATLTYKFTPGGGFGWGGGGWGAGQ
jgi:outer membrane immunogenic protein